MILKEDIVERIKNDFRETSERAFSLLEHTLQKNNDLYTDRLIRCVVFLSKGNIDALKKNIDATLLDPRDVMLWAEYDIDQLKRRRDFSQTFEESEKDVLE